MRRVSRFVLDSSAVIAVIIEEPGSRRVLEVIERSVLSSVNLTEIVTKLLDRGLEPEMVRSTIDDLRIPVKDFTATDALAAGLMRDSTRHLGLSLGDRACLALAGRLGAVAVTADKAWAREKLPWWSS